MPKVFGTLRERYANRPGGYTRVLRCESHKEDQSPSAILELVDGPRDMRFMMTAKTLVNERADGRPMHDFTAANVDKVTRFRPDGHGQLEKMVREIETRAQTVDKVIEEEDVDGEKDEKSKVEREPRTNREAYEKRRRMGESKEQVYIPYSIENGGQRLTAKDVKEQRKQKLEKWKADQRKLKA